MEKEPAIQSSFRKLEVDLPSIRQENSLFWWLAGIVLAILILALSVHYYALHKLQRQRPSHPTEVQQTTSFS